MTPNIKVDVHDLNVTYHDEIEKKCKEENSETNI